MSELLSIRDLHIGRTGDAPSNDIVKGVDISVGRGQILGIVGETGAGKTLTMRALLGALPEGLVSTAASATFDDDSMTDISAAMARLRGDRIGIVVQDPVAALPPIRTVGRSLSTILRTHRRLTRKQARDRVEQVFAEVGLPDPRAVFRMRPHELSGGMAQRVVIAAAFLADPDLIVADEPTTALDPTVQLQILTLLQREVADRNAGAVIITHDMGVVAQVCTHVTVLFAGEVKESGTVEQVLTAPTDPYTIELLRSIPDAGEFHAGASEAVSSSPVILEAQNVTKTYPGRSQPVLEDVGVSVQAGRTTAIVGESGAGKTTLVRSLLKLESIDSGRILFDGVDVTSESPGAFRPRRRDLQVVYQNPSAALNPRVRIEDLLLEPLLTFPETAPSREARADRVKELMDAVRLDASFLDRFPPELSGGQKQRVAIARALATRPKVIVLDEPTASLDVSVRRHVLDLLSDLQDSLGIAYVLISHDFNTVRHLAHDVTVLYRGKVVESGPAEVVLTRPSADYTRSLIAAELSASPSGSGHAVRSITSEAYA